MTGRRIEHALLARPHAEKEQRGRGAALPRRRGGRVVLDRSRNEAEHETRLVPAEVQQGPLAERVGSGGLAVHADEPEGRRPVDEIPLDRREDVTPSGCRQRERLSGVADRVVGHVEHESRMTEQVPLGRLHDGRDQQASRGSAAPPPPRRRSTARDRSRRRRPGRPRPVAPTPKGRACGSACRPPIRAPETESGRPTPRMHPTQRRQRGGVTGRATLGIVTHVP